MAKTSWSELRGRERTREWPEQLQGVWSGSCLSAGASKGRHTKSVSPLRPSREAADNPTLQLHSPPAATAPHPHYCASATRTRKSAPQP